MNLLRRDPQARASHQLPLGGMPLDCPPALAGHSQWMVRPEDIVVGPVQAGAGEAVVLLRTFLGDRVQLTLSVPDQAPLQAEVRRDHPAKTGDRVGIHIHPDRLMPCEETA